jgi:two-component system chemotaxis response regulator CheB
VIRVLVVDDSAVLRQGLRFILESDPELKVIGEAKNGEEAIALAKRLQPNVITMDIRMPKMDGLEAIRHIMAENPVPIVVVSSIDLNCEIGIASQATKLGAVSIVRRPVRISDPKYKAFVARLIEQVKLMSDVKVIHQSQLRKKAPLETRAPKPRTKPQTACKTQVIAIGASTGGPAALNQILSALPASFLTTILVVQHISFGFVEGLAGWLDAACKLQVKVAEHGKRIEPGAVHIAPDDQHMEIDVYGRIRLNQSGPVDGHRPSVTVLFESVAQAYGPAAMGVILTGMGSDGAVGMKALREAEAITIAQDQESCVVFGMPKEAIALDAIQHIVPLEKMAQTMMALCVE